jgi:predicted DNA-binding transcriptional regulator YafY
MRKLLHWYWACVLSASFSSLQTQYAIEGAVAKTERVLPEALLQQVRAIQSSVAFNVIHYGGTPPPLHDNNTLIALSEAAQERHRVELVYRSWKDEMTERDFDPYGVVYTEGYWYTAGYCHLRQDLRTFRLDRIESITQRDEAFDDPGQFDVLGYVLSATCQCAGSLSGRSLAQDNNGHGSSTHSQLPRYAGAMRGGHYDATCSE